MNQTVALNQWLTPNWPIPENVYALITTRHGGVSHPPYASLNLGDHVGDDPNAVIDNRGRLNHCLIHPPIWLTQTHSTTVIDAESAWQQQQRGESVMADAIITTKPGVSCVVMTADCLPLLICDCQGTRVAAVHAGWRGLVGGIVEQTIAAMQCSSSDLLVYLGPAISQAAFEVGDEVRATFVAQDSEAATQFQAHPVQEGKWYADLYGLAKQRLHQVGVNQVFGGEWCTVRDETRFFSFRRDGVTGRMASCIGIKY